MTPHLHMIQSKLHKSLQQHTTLRYHNIHTNPIIKQLNTLRLYLQNVNTLPYKPKYYINTMLKNIKQHDIDVVLFTEINITLPIREIHNQYTHQTKIIVRNAIPLLTLPKKKFQIQYLWDTYDDNW